MSPALSSLVFDDLKNKIQGEILTDQFSVGMYATDASLYQVMPYGVVLPKSEEDVLSILQYCHERNIPVLPRGAGTSLAGQAVAKALIMDMSKYMTKILDMDENQAQVTVQPGIVLDILNNAMKVYGLTFAPDPATASRANIGGMIANNSSGTKSILYGKTSDHVLSLKIALSDGTVLYLENLDMENIHIKCRQDDKEGAIYKKVRKIVFENSEEIDKSFPKTMRRVSGYALDSFINNNTWNLSNLICGSEGTLAIILEARLKLVPIPKYKAVCPVHFYDEMEAVEAIQTMVKYQPSAVETLDKTLIKMSLQNLETKAYTGFMSGVPTTIQIVEFYGNDKEEIRERADQMIKELKFNRQGYAYPFFYHDEDSYHHVWIIRKKGLGLLLSRSDTKKATAFIEDAAIPLEHLTDYVKDIRHLCAQFGVELAIYGHASVGVLHLRPFLDMMDQHQVKLFEKIARETFSIVRKYGGSWSSEHGDGRVRSPFIKEYYGDALYQAFREIKEVFDPKFILNPGNIIDPPSLTENMRYSPPYHDKPLSTVYKYRSQGSFQRLVHECTGVGECRKLEGGSMCPSYRATLDEEHSTRGRANVLRLTMSGQLANGNMAHPELLDTLDLCLSCKACKSECPSSVDMAKLKSEVLQKKYTKERPGIREWFIRESHGMASLMSGIHAPIINMLQKSYPFRWMLEKMVGISSHRILPAYHSDSFSNWYRKNDSKPEEPIGTVAFFADTYVRYHDPEPGKAAVRLLQQCGYEVILLDKGCCQRPRISNGFLNAAKRDGTKLLESWASLMDRDIPIVACEPSCVSALQDDLPDLVESDILSTKAKKSISTLESFLYNEKEKGRLKGQFVPKNKQIIIHGHCHDKALYGKSAIKELLGEMDGFELQMPDTGCCGMAGSFGYEKEHYKLSVKIAEDSILPTLRKHELSTVVANGFSCRHQIMDLEKRKSYYWAEIVDFEREM